ncbi:MAG: SPOR domain-containing protein [Gammaproteobacteria bacterium]
MARKIVLAALPADKNITADADADAGAEIVYLLLHLVRRQAFKQLGATQRDTVLDEVSRLAITGYARAVLDADVSQEAFLQNAGQMMCTLKSRQSIYTQCESFFGESFPGNGTMVFALSFFVYRAMGHTDRNDVDEILTGKRDISDSESEDFPGPPEIMAAARAMESIVDELQIPSDSTISMPARKPAIRRNLSMFFGWIAAGVTVVALIWWAKSVRTTDDSSMAVLEADETIQTSQAPGLQSRVNEVRQPGDNSAHQSESEQGPTGLATNPEPGEMRSREIPGSVIDAEHKIASSTSLAQPVFSGAAAGLEPLQPPVIAGHTGSEAHASTNPGAETVAGVQSGSRKSNPAMAGKAAVPEHKGSASSEQPAVSVDNQGPWVINLVSSPSRVDADRLTKKAQSRDIQAQQQQVTVKGKQYWRVQITGFSTQQEARAYAETVKSRLELKDVWIMKR